MNTIARYREQQPDDEGKIRRCDLMSQDSGILKCGHKFPVSFEVQASRFWSVPPQLPDIKDQM